MEFYYQGTSDKLPIKITIIQYSEKGKRVEIIRNAQIQGRDTFAGFWVNEIELIKKE